MNKKVLIDKNIMRHVIPFSFQTNKKTTFQMICDNIMKVKGNNKEFLWEEYCIGNKECDLYDSIQKLMQCSSTEKQGIGQVYRINPNCKQKYLPILNTSWDDGDAVELLVTDMGLHIFQTGVGFLWYELNIKTSDINIIMSINSALKELVYSNKKILITKTEMVNKNYPNTNYKILSDIPLGESQQLFIKIDGKNAGYIRRTELINEIENEPTLIFYYRNNQLWFKYRREVEFSFALFITEQLSPFYQVDYFASREINIEGKPVLISDKAILFSIIIEQGLEGKDMLPYLYWIGKGYVDSYFVPSSFVNNSELFTYESFQNSVWYSSIEGCSQITCKSDNEVRSTFFDTTYISRIEDYFYIYTLVLYQYYGLLKYNNEISKFPNDISGYNKIKTRRLLNEYKQKLSFYLMNSMFLDVSHISHHNMFFDYIKESYKITTIASFMIEKISLVNDIVERWRQRQRDKRVLSLSITGGVFVTIQTLNNIIGIYDYFRFDKYIKRGTFSLITLMGSILIGIIIWICIKDSQVD